MVVPRQAVSEVCVHISNRLQYSTTLHINQADIKRNENGVIGLAWKRSMVQGSTAPCKKNGVLCENSGTLHTRCDEYNEFRRNKEKEYKKRRYDSDIIEVNKQAFDRIRRRQHT